MKPALLVFALTATLALPVFAQTTTAAGASNTIAKPAFAPAPPPPGMNDPGVKAVAPEAAPVKAPQSTPATQSPTRMGDQPVINDPSSAGRDPSQPQVAVRQEGDNTIEEFRENGRVTMVVVTPKHGVPQTYNVDPDGRLHDVNGSPPVTPVMYKVLEWGKAKPTDTDADTSVAPDDGGAAASSGG